MASRFRVQSCRVFGFWVLGFEVSCKPQARKLGNQVIDRSITTKHKIEAKGIANSILVVSYYNYFSMKEPKALF